MFSALRSYDCRAVNTIQIGILLQLIGTVVVILIAGVFLSPEVLGKSIPNYVIRTLTKFASKLQKLAPQQFVTLIKKLPPPLLGGLIIGLLVYTSIFFLVTHYNNVLYVLGAVMGFLAILIIAFFTLPPLFSLGAARLQSSIWDKGESTPTERAHPIKISLLRRLKFVVLSFGVVIVPTLLSPVLLLFLLDFALAFAWRSVMQFLANEKAPRMIALFIGLAVLLAGLIVELIGTL